MITKPRKKLAGFAAAIALSAITVTGVAPTLAGAQVAPPDAKVRVADLKTGSMILSVSNNGNTVLFNHGSTLKIRDLDAKKTVELGVAPYKAAISGDGSVVYTSNQVGDTYEFRRFAKASGWKSKRIGSTRAWGAATGSIEVNTDGSYAILRSTPWGDFYNYGGSALVVVLSEKGAVDKTKSFCDGDIFCATRADIVDNTVVVAVDGELLPYRTVTLDLNTGAVRSIPRTYCPGNVYGMSIACITADGVTADSTRIVNLMTGAERSVPSPVEGTRVEAVADNGRYVLATGPTTSPYMSLVGIDMKTGATRKLASNVQYVFAESANGRAAVALQHDPTNLTWRYVTVAH